MANWLAQHLDRNPEIARLPVYKRDRYSLHVRQRDGSVMAEFSTRPLHFRDEHGIWQPLDTSLRAAGNEYGAPGLDVFVAPDGGVRVAGTKHHQRTGRVVVLDIATGKVKRVIAGDLGAGRIEDDSLLRDAGAFQHRLRVTATGLREELTISGPLGGTSAAEWLMIETEVRGRNLPDGWLDSLKWAGRYQFRTPTCTDAGGARIAARQYALKQGNRQMLYTGVPLAWLAGAVYPVVLDPDFAVVAADGYVQGTSYSSFADARATATFFSSTDPVGYVGNVLVSGKSTYWTCHRGYLAFATAGIGTNPVLAATLRLAVRSYDFTQLQDDLEITKFDWSAWNPVSSGNQEAVYDAALVAPKDVVWQEAGFSFTNNAYYDSAEPLDTSWINRIGATYYGLLTKRDRDAVEPTGVESVTFYTSESSYPPILRVIYGEAAVDAAAIAAAVRDELSVELAMLDATVSSRLASGSYTAPLDAAGMRNAIGMAAADLDNQLDAILAVPGGLTAQEMADALLLAPDGEAAEDSAMAQLAGVRAKTDLITTGAVTVTSPVTSEGDVTVYQGDDYHSGDGCALAWSSDGWPDLTDATIQFYVKAPSGHLLTADGSVVDAGEVTQTARVELTAEETATLVAWPGPSELRVRATLANGRVRTLVDSTLAAIEELA